MWKEKLFIWASWNVIGASWNVIGASENLWHSSSLTSGPKFLCWTLYIIVKMYILYSPVFSLEIKITRCKSYMYTTFQILLNFLWSKNWNVKVQQVSHLQWISGWIKLRNMRCKILSFFTYSHLYLKFNQKIIWKPRIDAWIRHWISMAHRSFIDRWPVQRMKVKGLWTARLTRHWRSGMRTRAIWTTRSKSTS